MHNFNNYNNETKKLIQTVQREFSIQPQNKQYIKSGGSMGSMLFDFEKHPRFRWTQDSLVANGVIMGWRDNNPFCFIGGKGCYGVWYNKNNYKNDATPSMFVMKPNERDFITACIELNPLDDKYYLYFLKNGDTKQRLCNNNLRNKCDSKNFTNDYGYIELDFEKYYWFYALSTLQCGCQFSKDDVACGFEYEIELD